MKNRHKVTEALQDIHIFQFISGSTGECRQVGTIRRKVHRASPLFPDMRNCADLPLRHREFFWITLFRSINQKWPVSYEENYTNLDWVVEGWRVTLPSNVRIGELIFW